MSDPTNVEYEVGIALSRESWNRIEDVVLKMKELRTSQARFLRVVNDHYQRIVETRQIMRHEAEELIQISKATELPFLRDDYGTYVKRVVDGEDTPPRLNELDNYGFFLENGALSFDEMELMFPVNIQCAREPRLVGDFEVELVHYSQSEHSVTLQLILHEPPPDEELYDAFYVTVPMSTFGQYFTTLRKSMLE